MRVVLAFLAVLSLASAQGRLAPAKIAAVERLVAAEMSSQHIPGMSVAVASQGEVWSNGYGLADLENFVPAQASTVYRTASVAKPMTAVAAVQLAQAGKLDLDADIHQYLPSFPKKPWPISMRQLLGHLGGIRHYKDGAESSITSHYSDLESALQIFAADDLVAQPGTKFVYSTFGYVLVGRVVEAIAGIPFVEAIQKNVFLPAGMTRTQPDDVYQIISGRSRGYARLSTGEVRNAALHDTSHKIPGGGLVSTAGDLVRFAMALDGGKLLKPESLSMMFESLRTRDGKPTGYGLGWAIQQSPGVRYYMHEGGQAGVSTVLAYLPAQHAAVAMMFNLQGVQVRPVLERVLEVLLQ